ncbi:uncharacterized protein LOC133291366 [Gastrolobium bilobum]|uniref:uncharacterized protein LOC133291366 n=1 Tax=Gastrolobium bilobum TaxID=150636 RepID=UPI002AB29DDC|nr:uncharacterized protein LOC133291366 [Gastrolobium bilobum]
MARDTTNVARSSTTEASSGSSASMDDSSSPCFLQSGDHLGLVLVTHTLSGSNFHSWIRAMTLALTAKNKLAFVDGSLFRPPSTDLLFQLGIDSDLKTRYSQANGPRIFQLNQQISSLCQGSLDITSYYTKLKSLYDELHDYLPLPRCTCDTLHEMTFRNDQDHVLQFLIGLYDSFYVARAQILLLDPLPSLAKVFSMILQEERRVNFQCHYRFLLFQILC